MMSASFVRAPSAVLTAADDDDPHVYVHPGHLLACTRPTRVSTIVGSCVAVCLADRRLRIGGLCHFLLPAAPQTTAPLPRPHTYADRAIPALIDQLLGLGSRMLGLEAKLFGGAHLLGSGPDGGPGFRNVVAARTLLADERIPIVAEDVSGPRGRKLLFDSGTGSVLVRLL